MGNLNKIISLIIGLVTVIVFFAVLTGRINLRGKKTITPTPTVKVISQTKISPTPTLAYVVNRYQGSNNKGENITQIPSTGLPILFTSGLLASLSIGVYLRRKK